MTKISDLPSIVNTESLYYDGCVLVTNGYDNNGDYVTGQIGAVKIIDEYINNKIDWNSPIFQSDSEAQFLYATYYNTDKYYLCGLSIDDLASNIASYISENDYLYNYISSSISDYISNGLLSDYLSEYMSSYVADGYLNSYITSQIGSYVDNMSTRAYTSEISGIVVKYDNELAYVDGSNFEAMIRSCVFYTDSYPGYLSDGTELAGLYLSATMAGVDGYIAPITLGDIVSYIKSQI